MGDEVLAGPAPTEETIGDAIFDKINARAVEAAREQAGELVTGVGDATREAVRAAIADGMAAGERYTGLIARIEGLGAFSAERADLIGETELATANSMGAIEGFQQAIDAGVSVKKAWLVAGGLERVCVVCQGNQAAGPVGLDDPFPSDDMTPPGHPRCRCALVPVVDDDDAEKRSTKRGMDVDRRYDTQGDRDFRDQFRKIFGPEAAEREFHDAFAALEATPNLRKINQKWPLEKKVRVVFADQAAIRRASDSIGPMLGKIERDIAHLKARAQRDAAKSDFVQSTN